MNRKSHSNDQQEDSGVAEEERRIQALTGRYPYVLPVFIPESKGLAALSLSPWATFSKNRSEDAFFSCVHFSMKRSVSLMKTTSRILRWGVLFFGASLMCNTTLAQRTATAVATVINGFVVSITLTDGGSGYPQAPLIRIIGGGGTGARAVAAVTNGVVFSIIVEVAGSGYTGSPQVAIDAPPYTVIEEIVMIPQLKIDSQAGRTNTILFSDDLTTGKWYVLTNVFVAQTPFYFVDTTAAKNTKRYYKVAFEDTLFLARPSTNAFVWIEPGNFMMGSPVTEPDRWPIEGPQTAVTLTKGFWMAKYEVTQEEFTLLMNYNPSFFQNRLNPVESVSWEQAMTYCQKVTERERKNGNLPNGYSYRLPTEAEWEYAARAGTTTRFSFGDDSGYALLGTYAWVLTNAAHTTHAVGQKAGNPWGLYDMSGNVWEWCLDLYRDSLPGGSTINPMGPTAGNNHVIKGGCYDDPGSGCHSASRWPGIDNSYVGFRIVLVKSP